MSLILDKEAVEKALAELMCILGERSDEPGRAGAVCAPCVCAVCVRRVCAPCSSLLSSAIFYSKLPETCRNVTLSRHTIVNQVVTPQGLLA